MIAFLLALSIAFPKEGQRLPPVTQCYVIGATEPGTTGLVVRGASVDVYRTGAWATMVDVTPGTNVIAVGGVVRTFFVEAPRPPSAVPAQPPKPYEKLPYAGDVARPSPRGRKPADITIVLDPGHGGADAGALSPHGIEEKDANLRTAKAVRRELLDLGFRVTMTREDDTAVPLYDRPKAAHRVGADAFVSIHHNAPPCNRDPRTLRYHATYAWNPLGDALGKCINARMAAALGATLANNGVPRANYAVTRNPEIPSCLVEVDFITSPEGEEASWSPDRRRQVAKAVAAGIADWCERSEP